MGMGAENPSGMGMKGFNSMPNYTGGYGMGNTLAGGGMGGNPFMPQAPQGYPTGYPLPGNIMQSYGQQMPGMYTGQGQGFQGAGQGFQGNMGPMAPGSTQSNPQVASGGFHHNNSIHPITVGGQGGGGQQNYLFNSSRFM